MLLSENFLEIWVQAHKTSPKIVGQLLLYNETSKSAKILPENKATEHTTKGFKLRWIFLLSIQLSMLLRILDLKFSPNYENKTVEINLCAMMLFICVETSEGYRVWAYNPNLFLSFFNNIFLFERKHNAGVKISQAPLTWKIARHVCQITRFASKWIFAIAISICCVFDNNIPFNTAWLLNQMLGETLRSSPILRTLEMGITFLLNYCNWTLIATRAYLVVADLLLGTISLTYCQDVAYRY